MDDVKKEITQEEADRDFKNMVAKVFKEKVPDSFVDEDGLICVPFSTETEGTDKAEPEEDGSGSEAAVMVRLYVVTEDGVSLDEEMMEMLKIPIRKRGWGVRCMETGEILNRPNHLLEELKDHYDEAIVIGWNVVDDFPRPMYFVDPGEIDPLIESLEEAGENEDSWDICRKVHKRIRCQHCDNQQKT